MAGLTKLRSDITELAQGASIIRRAADDAEDATALEVWDDVTGVIRYLDYRLFPYLAAEDELLIPLLDAGLGSPVAGRILAVASQQIARISDEIDESRRELLGNDHSAVHALRRLLDELHIVVRFHLTAVETAVLPVLERELSEHDADNLQAAMTAASHTLRSDSPLVH